MSTRALDAGAAPATYMLVLTVEGEEALRVEHQVTRAMHAGPYHRHIPGMMGTATIQWEQVSAGMLRAQSFLCESAVRFLAERQLGALVSSVRGVMGLDAEQVRVTSTLVRVLGPSVTF